MTINYKDRIYIHHPDGKFTEEQLRKALDAVYEIGKQDGYNDGYEAGKKNSFTITYPSYPWTGPYYTEWWKSPWYVTTTAPNKINITPTSITTATSTNPPSVTTATTNANREFKYNGTER